MRAVVTGTGGYLPARVLTNDDLSRMVDTSDEWIYPRTGIRSRRIAAAGENVSDMAAAASREAMERAGVGPEEIDLLVLATITPDTPLPAASCLVQHKLGLVNATCFDIAAACSGFIYALDVARQYVLSGAARKVLVAGSEKMSAITDWTDRTTCILFGDGAGAVVVERSEGGTQNGILSTATGTDGSLAPLLCIEAGGSALPASAETLAARKGFVRMDGHTIFKYAVRNMAGIAAKAVADAGLEPSDIDWFVPHQANMRIIQAVAKTMDMPADRVVVNIENTGNTTAASIPLALHDAVADGRIKPGDNVLFGSFGAGLTWGAAVVRWGR
ncbi:MAG: ketoacyl-ACP synthase III [Kiritimatiellae bacterium]|nr:ketoacyl-ACP synthase III [Kiritimatiellia bacterium]